MISSDALDVSGFCDMNGEKTEGRTHGEDDGAFER
jgi:hypothetical protein